VVETAEEIGLVTKRPLQSDDSGPWRNDLQPSSQFLRGGFAALLIAAAIAVAMEAQAPAATGGGSTPAPLPRVYAAPTNLKVLPKDMTGEQVEQLMEQWQAALGVHCSSCHTEDRENLDAAGRPLLKFADDSKGEKRVARLMYEMTEEINQKYIAKIDSSGVPVNCGTCHHGRLVPDPFQAPSDRQVQGPPPAAEAAPPSQQ
jgi:mono/diheme cytochrome c family protein